MKAFRTALILVLYSVMLAKFITCMKTGQYGIVIPKCVYFTGMLFFIAYQFEEIIKGYESYLHKKFGVLSRRVWYVNMLIIIGCYAQLIPNVYIVLGVFNVIVAINIIYYLFTAYRKGCFKGKTA